MELCVHVAFSLLYSSPFPPSSSTTLSPLTLHPLTPFPSSLLIPPLSIPSPSPSPSLSLPCPSPSPSLSLPLLFPSVSSLLSVYFLRHLEWRHLEATVNADNTVDVRDVTNDAKEHLEFQDRIIKASLGWGHLIVTTSTQCYIFK